MKAAPSLCLRCTLAILFVAFIIQGSANAQVAPLVTQAVDPAQRQVLSNTIHPLVKNSADLGRVDSSLAMKDMLLMLHPSAQPAAIAQFIDSLQNPHSANFRRWLTPEQYAAKFGISDADVTTVSAWLTSNGFTVEQVSRGKNWIRFTGTASQVESAFQTEIHKYSLNGATQYANAQNISIPAALAPAVAGVASMSSFQSQALHTPPQKMVRGSNGKMTLVSGTTFQTLKGVKPDFTATNGQTVNFLAPADFSAIYDAKPVVSSGIDGTGVSIAIVGRSDIAISDVEAFRAITGLPFNDPTVIYANFDPGVLSGDNIEGSLDVEWAGAIAPKDSIQYVIGASTTTTDGVDIASSYIVDNVTAPIMNVSFGLCEQLEPDSEIAFYQSLWLQAAAEGITVFVAAGDSGASNCNAPTNRATSFGFGVSALASTPYTVAVGGTELNDQSNQGTYWNTANGPYLGSAIGYIPEAVWNESCESAVVPSATNCAFPPYNLYSFAGGGGASSCISRTTDGSGFEYCAGGYPKPSWQTGPGVPQDGVRDIPDVSLTAAAEHDPFIVCYEGGCEWTTNSDGSITLEQADIVGGTSAAAPSMASIMALVEQKTGTFQGVANYELYRLAAAQTADSCNSSSRTDPTQTSTCVFNDITTGSNAVPCISPGQDCGGTDQPVQVGSTIFSGDFAPNAEMNGHSATAGYDLGSGLGSVDISNLVNSWGKQNLAASTTTLTLSQTTFQHGITVKIGGTVSPASGSGTPTGSVLIQASSLSGSVVNFPLATGAFNGSTINLPGGAYTVTATYSGDGVYAASTSAPVPVNVTPENSTVSGTSFAYTPITIASEPQLEQLTAALLGFPWYLQFNVAGTSGSIRATGSITLSQGSSVVGTYPLSSNGEIYVSCGQGAGCDFPAGALNFTAKYSGDNSFNPSTTTYQFTVLRGLPGVYVQVNNETPISNTQDFAYVNLTVTDQAIPPTGTVTLTRSDTGALLGSAVFDQTGLATIPFNVGSGSYTVLPSWPGDANYKPPPQAGSSTLLAPIQTQNSTGTVPVTVTLNLGASSFGLGQRTQYTITVTPTQKSASTPIGFVDLFSSLGPIASQISLSGGKATGTVEWDSAGPQTVYAIYGGDGNSIGANSSFATVTVTQATPALTIQPIAAYAAAGTATSVSGILSSPLASTSAPAPTGTIQFYDSLNGAAAASVGAAQGVTTYNGLTLLATLAPTLPQGSNVVTAVYSGDANWKSASSAPSAPIVVTTSDFAVTAATPSPLTITAGQSAALSVATQSLQGGSAAITLSCGGTLPAGMSCNTATVNSGASGTITLTTIAPGTTSVVASVKSGSSFWKVSGTIAFAAIFFLWIPNRRRFARLSVLLVAMAVGFGIAGCGGSNGTASQPSGLTLTSSFSKVASGGSVTFLASLTSPSNTGSVTFYDGTTALGSAVTPQNGVAAYTTSVLSVGTHSITAKYTGTSGNQTLASSDILAQTVTGSFTLMISGTSGQVTQSLTVPATLQ